MAANRTARRSSGAEPTPGGPPVGVLAHVQVRPDADLGALEQHLAGGAATVAAWQVTGESDYVVRLACRSLPDVEAELRRVRAHPAVRRVTAEVLLHQVTVPAASGLGGSGPAASGPAGAGTDAARFGSEQA